MTLKLSSAFTLIELLMVILIVAMLAAILFPVFSSVREKARTTACASNMKQIGIAISMYAADSDDHYPIASDSPNRLAYLWHPLAFSPSVVANMPTLRDVLKAYLEDKAIWRCPSDSGEGSDIMNDLHDVPVDVALQPTAYDRFGTSYLYRGSLGASGILYPGDCTVGSAPNLIANGPARSGVLVDAYSWHVHSEDYELDRANLLYADAHVRLASSPEFIGAWLCDPQ